VYDISDNDPILKNSHYNDVMMYCNDITSKKILSGVYCKKAVGRFLSDLKKQNDEGFPYTFIPSLADQVIDFAQCLIIPDISTDDKKLVLLPWMKFVYYNLFGWVYKDDHDRRRFRSGYIEVARKNSKTTSILFPTILWDFLITDAAEAYFVSKDTFQADKSYRELKNIIKADDDLKQVISETVYEVRYKNSRISFFTSESKGLDSYKNSMSVIDEFHAYETDAAVTAFRYGGTGTEKQFGINYYLCRE
jgi:phage terminase large subunit-like protein